MRPYLIKTVFDTKKQSLSEIEKEAQSRLDVWLGKGNVVFSINQPGPKTLEYTFERKYGNFYKDPRCWSDCNEHIFSWDKHIFLGTGWKAGTYADFSNLNGPYVINYGLEDFLREIKEASKEYHASRARSVMVDNYLDRIIITVEYV
jgi:hypothetical protein